MDGSAAGSGTPRPRNHGALRTLDVPTPHDHACAGYLTDLDRARMVADWIVAGLELGQRCLYVGNAPSDELLAELPAIVALDAAVHSGTLVAVPSTDLYDLSRPIEPSEQLATYAAAVEDACADGHLGLRVVADMTPLVADPSRRRSHLRWEQYADRYITNQPLAPLCMYDRRLVDGLDAIVCAHPLHGDADRQFALYGEGPRAAALAGELDASVWEVAADVLDAIPDADELLDLTELSFVDGGSAAILHDALAWRRARGRPLRVVGVTRPLRRVWEVCGFDPSLIAAA